MSAIQQFGLELDDLRALLDRFGAFSQASNEGVTMRNGQMEPTTTTATGAARDYVAALAQADTGCQALADASRRMRESGTTTLDGAGAALAETGGALEASGRATGGTVDQGAEGLAAGRAALGRSEAQAQAEVTHLVSEGAQATAAMLALSATHLTQIREDSELAGAARKELREAKETVAKEAQEEAARIATHADETVPTRARALADWVGGQLTPALGGVLDRVAGAADSAFSELDHGVTGDVNQGSQDVAGALRTATAQMQQAGQELQGLLSREAVPMLNGLQETQKTVSQSFEPAQAEARKTTDKFVGIRHRLDILKAINR